MLTFLKVQLAYKSSTLIYEAEFATLKFHLIEVSRNFYSNNYNNNKSIVFLDNFLTQNNESKYLWHVPSLSWMDPIKCPMPGQKHSVSVYKLEDAVSFFFCPRLPSFSSPSPFNHIALAHLIIVCNYLQPHSIKVIHPHFVKFSRGHITFFSQNEQGKVYHI